MFQKDKHETDVFLQKDKMLPNWILEHHIFENKIRLFAN